MPPRHPARIPPRADAEPRSRRAATSPQRPSALRLFGVADGPAANPGGERFSLQGIDCQVAHVSVGAFEREITRVVDRLELTEELLKIMSGLFEGRPLYGEELIEQWRRRAALTQEVQRALIEKRWSFFPWWYFQEERLRAPGTS